MREGVLYVRFPLFLMQGYFEDRKNTLNKILCYGLYWFSKRQTELDTEYVAKQLIYDYYRDGLTDSILDFLESIGERTAEIFNGDDYKGFYGLTSDDERGKQFNPEIEIEEILKLFKEYPPFEKIATEWCRMKTLNELLKLYSEGCFESPSGMEAILNIGQDIEKLIPKGEPMPMVKISHLLEFRDKVKGESEAVQFAMYLAINSIVGKNESAKTNRQLILSRMIGYKSYKAVEDAANKKEINPTSYEISKKYNTRTRFTTLRDRLEDNWHVTIYSHKRMRGYIIGKNLTEERAVEIAVNQNKAYKAKLKKARRNAIYDQIMEREERKANKGVQQHTHNTTP